MKKSISLLTLVVLFGITGGNVSYASQPDDGNPASRRETLAPGYIPYREYQLIRYSQTKDGGGNLNLSAGDVVIWDTVSDDGVSVGLVGTVGSVDAVAGVVVSANILTNEVTGTAITPGIDYGRRNWGWIQVKGYSQKVNITGGSASAGGALVASSTARYATGTVGEAAVAGAPLRAYRILGFAYDASAQGQSEAGIDL